MSGGEDQAPPANRTRHVEIVCDHHVAPVKLIIILRQHSILKAYATGTVRLFAGSSWPGFTGNVRQENRKW